MSISHLDPKLVFKHFEAICSIPHPSGHEEQLARHILDHAASRGFEAEQDAAKNVVVRVPATPGYEKAPIVVIQGHIDMVGEANAEANHDFITDPIEPYQEGDLVKARGTSLGADNGLGVAAGLAIADDEDAVHGPLELLCTVDEEVGLTGAMKLDPSFLRGRIMLNLDGEESNHAYIGCAGGGDTQIWLDVDTQPVADEVQAVQVKVSGLRGGHSGCDIHEQRGNALRVLGRCLQIARKEASLLIAEVKGGNKRNAIAREAQAVIVGRGLDLERIRAAIFNEADIIRSELSKIDPDLTLGVEPVSLPARVMDKASTARAIYLLLGLPHGVERMSDEIAGLVETSTNLASILQDGNRVRIEMSTRSSINESLQALRDRIAAVALLSGASVDQGEPYPGWKPDLGSRLAKVFEVVHEEALGVKPELMAIHAGLETGVIGEKFPGMDMISFGPDIRFPHSPDEQLIVSSVAPFYTLLKALLKRLAEG